jgi:hypothetical protein
MLYNQVGVSGILNNRENSMSTHEEQVQKIQTEIRKLIKDGFPVEVHIPGWKPVGIEEGFHWIKATIFEGYYLKYQVSMKSGVNVVSLLKWEFEEEEPEFKS